MNNSVLCWCGDVMYYYSIGTGSPSSAYSTKLSKEDFAGFNSVEFFWKGGTVLVVVGTEKYIKKDFSLGWQHPTLATLAAKGYFVSWLEESLYKVYCTRK